METIEMEVDFGPGMKGRITKQDGKWYAHVALKCVECAGPCQMNGTLRSAPQDSQDAALAALHELRSRKVAVRDTIHPPPKPNAN